MSPNIHTFDETRNANNNNNNQRGLLGNTSSMNNMFSFPSLNNQKRKDPREESFGYMIYINFCPMLSFCSFTVIISMVLTGMLLLQIGIDGLTKGVATQFLEINENGLLTSNTFSQYLAVKGKII